MVRRAGSELVKSRQRDGAVSLPSPFLSALPLETWTRGRREAHGGTDDPEFSRLNAEARAFIDYISPTPVEHELRMWTIEIIRRTIKSKYADADVQCFGSVGTGLYLPGG